MNPNPEVYGAPETWQNNFILGGATTAGVENVKASKAKVAKWNVEGWTIGTSQLRAAILNNKITANQPIDKSICPCGQDIRFSHLNQIGVFVSRNLTEYPDEDIQYITLINRMNNNDKPVNWCFFETRRPGSGASAKFQTPYRLDMSVNEYPYTVWAPGSDFDSSVSSKQNGNYYVSPLVSYQSRSILLRAEVGYISTRYTDTSPNGVTWISLDEWKNSYNTQIIAGIRLRIFKVNTASISQIKYNAPSINTYDFSGAMILDPITPGTTEYSLQPTFYHFGFMGMGQTGQITLLPIITGLSNQRQSNEYIYGFMPCMNTFESSELKTVRRSSSDSHLGKVWQEIPYSEDTYDKIMSMTALFGCPFTPSNTLTFDTAFTDPDLCLPVIDDNGITHGEYTRGSGNTNNPFINLDNVRDKDYKPGADVDPNTYSNTTGFNSLSGGASATIKYVLDSSNVRQLLTDLWTISHNIAGADYENYDYKILDSFLVSNPIDSIVSIKRFPFEIPHTFSTQKTNVCLGKNTGSAQGYVTHNVFNSVIFSGVEIYPKFGNSFLDYAPYTEYELYIPFCGTVKLNAGDILGHTLNCRLHIDLATGTCVAYIMADDLVIETASGVVSCELQVAGTDSATVDSNIQNAVLNHIGARTNKEIAMLSPLTFGGLLSAVSNPVKTSGAMENANNEISRADYNLTHIQTPVHSMGNAGGLTGWIQEFNARLIIYYPEGEAIDSSAPVSATSPHLSDLTAYAHNVGFACVMNGTVSEFHGKTVGNIDTSSIVGATEEERAQIKALFAQGVWLP